MLQRLHHFAWKCNNIHKTTHFYSKILKLPLVKSIKNDYVPSTGEYKPYEHIFFQLPDKSHIAFFKTDDKKIIQTNIDDWIIHFAFNVSNKEQVNAWKNILVRNNIDVIGPTNHDDWIYSIYFFDPNGLRLEITTELQNNVYKGKPHIHTSLEQLRNIYNAKPPTG